MVKKEVATKQIIALVFGIIFAILFAFLSVLILVEASKNGDDSTKSSSMIITIIQTLLPFLKGSDMGWVRKVIGHYGLFALTCGCAIASISLFRFKKKLTYIFYVVIAVWMLLLAMASEWLQTMAEGRGPSWTDVGIDTAGTLTSFAILGLVILIAYFLHKKSIKKSVSK